MRGFFHILYAHNFLKTCAYNRRLFDKHPAEVKAQYILGRANCRSCFMNNLPNRGVPVEEIASIPLPPGFIERGSQRPVPSNYPELLNERQRLALRTMEYFGWSLWFIRRSQEPCVAVIRESWGKQYAVLEPSGDVNMQPSLVVRH
jgi:hypothetical protein